MKYTVRDIVHVGMPPNTYEVEIGVYYGDADGYSTFTVGPFPTNRLDDMTLLLETLDRMKVRFQDGGRGGGDQYSYMDVEGFEGWFGTALGGTEEEWRDYCWALTTYEDFRTHRDAAGRTGTYPEWPDDPSTSGYDGLHGEATFDSYRVFYYNADGIKYSVQVEA